jgi:hypothetical protein
MEISIDEEKGVIKLIPGWPSKSKQQKQLQNE